MDSLKNPIEWIQTTFGVLNKKVDKIDANLYKTNERLNNMEEKLNLIENQNNDIKVLVETQSQGLETIKNLYKKDVTFRNKLTVGFAIFVLVFLLFIAFSIR